MTELLQELEKKYAELQQSMKLDIPLDKMDEMFGIRDYILSEGYVSPRFSRMLCRRIAEYYYSWVSFLHRLVLPNPNSMLDLEESKLFTDRKKITELIRQAMALVSKNQLVGVTKDKTKEKEFIVSAVEFYKVFSKELAQYTESISNMWAAPPTTEAKQNYGGWS